MRGSIDGRMGNEEFPSILPRHISNFGFRISDFPPNPLAHFTQRLGGNSQLKTQHLGAAAAPLFLRSGLSIEYQIDPVVGSFPDADGKQSAADGVAPGCELLCENLRNSLGGGGGSADFRVFVEVGAVELCDRCGEKVPDLVEIESIALVVERIGAHLHRNLPRVAVG